MRYLLGLFFLMITSVTYSFDCQDTSSAIFSCTGYDIESKSDITICLIPDEYSNGLILEVKTSDGASEPFSGSYPPEDVKVRDSSISLKYIARSLIYGNNWKTKVFIDLNERAAYMKSTGTYLGEMVIYLKCY